LGEEYGGFFGASAHEMLLAPGERKKSVFLSANVVPEKHAIGGMQMDDINLLFGVII
jgi:hypothetical protein